MIKELKKLHKDRQGFTLVELMIVVAIIGILAAIAIPQFSAYRMRAFNSSAQSDVRNVKTAQEVLQADHQVYGASDNLATLAAPTGHGGGLGATLTGPETPATPTVVGASLTSTTIAGTNVAVGIGIGNNVFLTANTEAAGVGSYVIVARHDQGPRSYGTDSDTTAIYFVEDPGMVGLGALTTGAPVSFVGSDNFAPNATIVPAGLTASALTGVWTAQ